MTARDGGIAGLLSARMPHVHWQSIETGGTGRGIPDLNACRDGREVWIELKRIDGWRINFRPEQVAWIERRTRVGGRVLVLARKKGREVDDLMLLSPAAPRLLISQTAVRDLNFGSHILGVWTGGPTRWDWAGIERALFI
jgi:Holliday junction resolvase